VKKRVSENKITSCESNASSLDNRFVIIRFVQLSINVLELRKETMTIQNAQTHPLVSKPAKKEAHITLTSSELELSAPSAPKSDAQKSNDRSNLDIANITYQQQSDATHSQQHATQQAWKSFTYQYWIQWGNHSHEPCPLPHDHNAVVPSIIHAHRPCLCCVSG
jgi:hypothetical protein